MSEVSDDDALATTAFAINEGDVGDYNVEDLPVNGHQYLHRVMKEAETLPRTVVADANWNRFISKQNFRLQPAEIFEVEEKYLPSRDWQDQQVEDFNKTRKTVSKMRARIRTEAELKIPRVNDSNDEWFNFIWKSDIKEPTLHVMFAFNMSVLDRVLNLFQSWLENEKILFEANVCLWIYSLLACLEIPLMPSTFSALRRIAELAIKCRAQMVHNEDSPNEKQIAQLNLLICLVGRYFMQTDLADDVDPVNKIANFVYG